MGEEAEAADDLGEEIGGDKSGKKEECKGMIVTEEEDMSKSVIDGEHSVCQMKRFEFKSNAEAQTEPRYEHLRMLFYFMQSITASGFGT